MRGGFPYLSWPSESHGWALPRTTLTAELIESAGRVTSYLRDEHSIGAPLLLCGDLGSGKTSLLEAVKARLIEDKQPSRLVAIISPAETRDDAIWLSVANQWQQALLSTPRLSWLAPYLLVYGSLLGRFIRTAVALAPSPAAKVLHAWAKQDGSEASLPPGKSEQLFADDLRHYVFLDDLDCLSPPEVLNWYQSTHRTAVSPTSAPTAPSGGVGRGSWASPSLSIIDEMAGNSWSRKTTDMLGALNRLIQVRISETDVGKNGERRGSKG